VFVGPDFVVFGRQDTLFAQRLNLRTFAMEGPLLRVADNVAQLQTIFGTVALSGSESGTLAYRPATRQTRQLTWFDRSGKPIGVVGSIDAADYDYAARLSRDGRFIALSRRVGGNSDVWIIPNSPQGMLQRLTSHAAVES